MDNQVDRLLATCFAVVEGRLPVEQLPPIGEDELAAIVDRIHAEMVEGEAARAAYATEVGHPIACGKGCDSCCRNIIVVYRPEAMRVAAWLGAPEQRAVRAGFERAYPGWRQAIGEDAARLKQLHERGEIAAAEALYAELSQRQVFCPFVEDHSCLVHPVRPNVCRNAHALDSSDRCLPDSERRPLAIAFTPLEQFVDRAAALFRFLHRQSRGAEGPSALATAVHQLLAVAGE